MKKNIIIRGSEELILSVSLLDIINQIEEPEKYSWNILWLEACGELENGTIIELENKINDSKNGLLINFTELSLLAKSFDQVIEILLIGDKNSDKLKRYNNIEDLYSECYFCIELLDSSYWSIFSSNDQFIRNIQENLESVELKK